MEPMRCAYCKTEIVNGVCPQCSPTTTRKDVSGSIMNFAIALIIIGLIAAVIYGSLVGGWIIALTIFLSSLLTFWFLYNWSKAVKITEDIYDMLKESKEVQEVAP